MQDQTIIKGEHHTMEDTCLKVGYGRTNITPDEPINLASYGTDDIRIHTEVANELFFSAIAFTDAEDRTLLLMSYDISQSNKAFFHELRDIVSEKYGIPKEYIHLSGTHTHSSVSMGRDFPAVVRYTKKLMPLALQAIEEAFADRKPARLFAKEVKAERMNFVRHYFRADGTSCGDNHGPWSTAPVVRHVKPADETMRIVKVERENADGTRAKDLVLLNWQAHNHFTGGGKKTVLAADFSGAIRECMERDRDCLFTFFQGCAGNLNEKSRIKEENRTTDYQEYGEIMADYIKSVYEDMDPVEGGPVVAITREFNSKINHENDPLLEDAKEIVRYWNEVEHDAKHCAMMGEKSGIHSYYMARTILNRVTMGDEFTIDINAYRIGDLGWTSAPVEMFDTTGEQIRAASPFKYTFTQGYTDSQEGYLPTEWAYDYGCYEADTTRFARGSAERMREQLVGMLHELRAWKN